MSVFGKIGGLFHRNEVKASVKPLINETVDATERGQSQLSSSQVDYATLYNYLQKSPEALIPVQTIVSDVISDGYYLEAYGGGGDGNKKIKAEKFLRDNFFNTEVSQALLYDAMATGDYYLYTPRIDESDMKSMLSDVVDVLPLNNKSWSENYIYNKYVMDMSFGASDLIPLASSTMTILHDKHQKVIAYRQRVGENTVDFSPEEIIHGRFMPMNGKVYGFTPLQAILSELSILSDAKDVIGYGMEAGGAPPLMYIMKDKDPSSPDYKNLEFQLNRLKRLKNRNRALLATGNIDVKDVGKSTKDMMYTELIDTFTRICMMVWGVPPSKMGMTSEASGAYDSGLATEGYYRRISNFQDWFYERINWELMIPQFGVQIIPHKSYRQDEVRETQVLLHKVQAAESMISNGWVNDEYVEEILLKIPEKYRGDRRKMVVEDNIMFNKPEVEKTQVQEEIDNLRRETQLEKVVGEVKSLNDSIEMLSSRVGDVVSEIDFMENRMFEKYSSFSDFLEKKSVEVVSVFERYQDNAKDVVRDEIKSIVENEVKSLRDLRERLSVLVDEEKDSK